MQIDFNNLLGAISARQQRSRNADFLAALGNLDPNSTDYERRVATLGNRFRVKNPTEIGSYIAEGKRRGRRRKALTGLDLSGLSKEETLLAQLAIDRGDTRVLPFLTNVKRVNSLIGMRKGLAEYMSNIASDGKVTQGEVLSAYSNPAFKKYYAETGTIPFMLNPTEGKTSELEKLRVKYLKWLLDKKMNPSKPPEVPLPPMKLFEKTQVPYKPTFGDQVKGALIAGLPSPISFPWLANEGKRMLSKVDKTGLSSDAEKYFNETLPEYIRSNINKKNFMTDILPQLRNKVKALTALSKITNRSGYNLTKRAKRALEFLDQFDPVYNNKSVDDLTKELFYEQGF